MVPRLRHEILLVQFISFGIDQLFIGEESDQRVHNTSAWDARSAESSTREFTHLPLLVRDRPKKIRRISWAPAEK